MMIYHPTKHGCKKISSPIDMAETVILDYMSLRYDPELEDSKQIFLAWHSGTWWCIATPSLVTKGSAVEEISSRWKLTGILNLFCELDLDHNRAIHSFHETIQLTILYHQTKFSCKRISRSEDILQSHVLIIWSFTVTLILKTSNQSFWKKIWLIMMRHHTKLGCKRLSDSGGII